MYMRVGKMHAVATIDIKLALADVTHDTFLRRVERNCKLCTPIDTYMHEQRVEYLSQVLIVR